MARIFMDGFELGDTSLWNTLDNAYAASSSFPAGFSGTYYLNCIGTWSAEKIFSTTYSDLYFAFKIYKPSTYSYEQILNIKDSAGTIIFSIGVNFISKYLEARLGTYNASVIATGTIPIRVLKAYLIELRYKPLNSGGVITVKVDGVQDINYSGDTTAGLEEIKIFHLGGLSGVDAYTQFDDIVVDNANWIGNTKLGIIVPNGTGTTNNWTASAGNAWDCLNEIPPVDTDYVYSNTTNQIATYAMTTIASMNSVKSIQLQGRAAYEGSPTPTKIQLGVRASGTDYFATDFSPGVGFGMLTKILELNPADSAAWEQADIDALEVGVKATA